MVLLPIPDDPTEERDTFPMWLNAKSVVVISKICRENPGGSKIDYAGVQRQRVISGKTEDKPV